jgi:DNA-damage-inducible protein J
MTNQILIQFRADRELKQEVEEIYKQLGMDLPTALRMFMIRSKQMRGLPFEAVLPEDNAKDSAEKVIQEEPKEAQKIAVKVIKQEPKEPQQVAIKLIEQEPREPQVFHKQQEISQFWTNLYAGLLHHKVCYLLS